MSKYINLDEAKARTTQLYHGYEVEQWLDTIPSINIDRPQGKWITVRQCSHGKIGRCSRCGKKYRVLCKWNFCPVCGADMRKGADNDR